MTMLFMPIAESEELLNVCMETIRQEYKKSVADLRLGFRDLFKRTEPVHGGIDAAVYMQRQEDYLKLSFRLEQDRAAAVYDIQQAIIDRAFRIACERADREQRH